MFGGLALASFVCSVMPGISDVHVSVEEPSLDALCSRCLEMWYPLLYSWAGLLH